MKRNAAKKTGRLQSDGWAKHLRRFGKKIANKLVRRAGKEECMRR